MILKVLGAICLPAVVLKFVALLVGVPLGAAENETVRAFAIACGLVAAAITWAWVMKSKWYWQ